MWRPTAPPTPPDASPNCSSGRSAAPGAPSPSAPSSRRPLPFDRWFLRAISAEVSLPYPPDKYIHIEYVPTQIVTEWLRTQFDPGEGQSLDGVIYGSARHPSGRNLALFIDNNGAIDPADDSPASNALLVLDDEERLAAL